MTESYDDRFPVGVQTVVEDRIVNNRMTYQVNTRYPNHWNISKTARPEEVKGILIDQASRYEEKFGEPVDKRYVNNFYR